MPTKERKYFVPDTNVFIHDPEAEFGENIVIICEEVLEELDGLKKSEDSSVAEAARKASSYLTELIGKGDAKKGVNLPNGGLLLIALDSGHPLKFKRDTPDNRIVSFAYGLSQDKNKQVVVISKDRNVRLKANGLGIQNGDYTKNQSDAFKRYGAISSDSDEKPNGILSVRYQAKSDGIWRFRGEDNGTLIRKSSPIFGISPRNEEQMCVIDALSCPEIETVALSGIAGSGKTLLALAVGLHQIIKEASLYDRLIIARPIVPASKDLGYLPGGMDDKLSHWMLPIMDNLDFIQKNLGSGNGFRKKSVEKGINFSRESLMASGVLQIESIAHIRGRSLSDTFIIIDEAQNLKPREVKTLITRCGERSKIVFCGDLEQIDTPYLNSSSSGLAHLINRFKDNDRFCYVRLVQSERSRLAEMGAKLL